MNVRQSSLTRATALALVIAACAVIAPAGAQSPVSNSVSIPATQPFAHTQLYSTCNEWCGTPNAWRVVTPFAETAGPEDHSPSWSPDGVWIAFVSGTDVVVMAAAGGPTTNLTNTADAEGPPAWSPDGAHIAFASNRTGEAELYLMRPDGSGVTRITTDNGVRLTRPSWSPDSARLVFECELDAGNSDICAIESDGSGFVRLTDDPARDVTPAWSPDSQTVAFSTDWRLALMRPDGTDVSPIAGLTGWAPAWAPDGQQIAFETVSDDGAGNPVFEIYRTNLDGSDVTFVAYGAGPAWMPLQPFVTFSVECAGLTCTFDASSSYGGIVGYGWSFGDQAAATGPVVSHTFAVGGTYTIELTVTDSRGATATASRTIVLNIPPVATFTFSCKATLTCVFDASGSYDSDGTIQRVEWAFGDGHGSDCGGDCPLTTSHTYAAGGTYTATLRITDTASATATASRTVTLGTPLMHVGDLDGSATLQPGPWTATVTIEVHDAAHAPIANAVVSAAWDKRTTVSCTTNALGRCVVSRSRIQPKGSAALTVTGVSHAVFAYQAAGNHDSDGDTDGTTIVVSRK